MAMKARMKGGPRSSITSLQVWAKTDGSDWLQAASPVNLTRLQESARHLVMSVTSGGNAPGLQANLDLPGASGRTSPDCSVPRAATSSPASSVTWPRWGMWSDGQLTALSMWERRTAGTESSSSATWPTPGAGDQKNRCSNGDMATKRVKSGKQVSLEVAVHLQKMWPTPAAQDAKNATLPPSQQDRDTVPGALMRSGAIGSLNPTWVEWLMGWPLGWTDLRPLETDKCHNAQL